MKDTPLSIKLENEELVIRIGVGTVAWAFEHSIENNPYMADLGDFRQRAYVTDSVGFANDVRRALYDEREDGSTILTDLLDKAQEDAYQDGSEHTEERIDNKSAYTRDAEVE